MVRVRGDLLALRVPHGDGQDARAVLEPEGELGGVPEGEGGGGGEGEGEGMGRAEGKLRVAYASAVASWSPPKKCRVPMRAMRPMSLGVAPLVGGRPEPLGISFA